MIIASLKRAQIIQKQIRRRGDRGDAVMTTLVHQLEGAIGDYLRGGRSLDDLREWLLDRVQQMLDSSDPRVATLEGELWRLLAEYDRRDRDEASVRTELERLLRDRGAPAQSASPPSPPAPLKPSHV